MTLSGTKNLKAAPEKTLPRGLCKPRAGRRFHSLPSTWLPTQHVEGGTQQSPHRRARCSLPSCCLPCAVSTESTPVRGRHKQPRAGAFHTGNQVSTAYRCPWQQPDVGGNTQEATAEPFPTGLWGGEKLSIFADSNHTEPLKKREKLLGNLL